MVEIKSLEKASGLDKSRRIMKYVLVYCSSGKLTLKVDENLFILRAGELITITSGQIHSVINSSRVSGSDPGNLDSLAATGWI